MLVKIANTLINPLDKDGEPIEFGVSAAERRERMGGRQFDIADTARNFLEGLGNAFAKQYIPQNDL